MESFAWWTEEQKKFADEVEEFAESILPRDAETRWTREFPWDIFRKIGEKHYTGRQSRKSTAASASGVRGPAS